MHDNRGPLPGQTVPHGAALSLALLLSTAACDRVGYRALEPRPNAGLSMRGGGISARVERIHVAYWQKNANMRADVRVINEGNAPLRVEPERIEIAPLDPEGAAPVADARLIDGEKSLDPGKGATYRIELARVPLESGRPYVLRLHPLVDAPLGALDPLPLVQPGKPHLGYGPPDEATWVFVGRVSGGAIRFAPVTAGLGGFEIFTGPQFGRFSVGLHAMIGAGSVGGEVRYRFHPTKAVAIVPFAGYGYYPLVGILGLNAGHGGRLGAEVQISRGDVTRFGWARSGGRVGFFAHAGPVYLRVLEMVAFAAQGGMTFGFF